jgi:putative DNA primase/helicase
VARAIVFGFDLGPEVGYRLLVDHYNPHCVPPWSETELRHKCKEADCKPYHKPRGYLLHTPQPALVFGANRPAALSRRSIDVETAGQAGGLATTCLASLNPEPVKFLVPDILPRGKLALVAGDGGGGKSVLTLALAAAVTTGKAAFGLTYDPPPASDVLLISCEDDFNDTVVPRLIALGADLNRCHKVDGSIGADGKVGPFSLAHFQAIGQELQPRKDVRLIVIDPAGAYIGNAGIDDHKDAQLRALLGPLAEVAAQHDVCVVLVKHLNRNTAAKAVNRVMGSSGYVNTVRAAFLVAPDLANDRRLFLPMKANLTPSRKGFAFRPVALTEPEALEALARFPDLEGDDRERLAKQLFRLEWLGAVEADPDEALSEATRKERSPKRVQECAEWMSGYLKDGPRPSKDIDTEGRKAGFTIDTINKAKTGLKQKGLHSSNRGQFGGKWWSGFGEPDSWVLKFPTHETHENRENHDNGTPAHDSGAQSHGHPLPPNENHENHENHDNGEGTDEEGAHSRDSHGSHDSSDMPAGGHETGPQVDGGTASAADLISKVADDPTSPLRPGEEEVQL